MGSRFLTITVLCLMGFVLGMTYTVFDVNNNRAERLNQMAPAAGEEKVLTKTIAGGDAIGGEFTLTDHQGNQVSSGDYGDKYKIVFFGFTYCPDVCPTGLQKITQTMQVLDRKLAENIQPLFISIDPERDTPDVLQTYVSQYHDSLIGLTGAPEDIKAIEKQYKVFAARVDDEAAPDGYSMNHSSYIFLMTPDDQLVTLFSHDDSAENMAAEITKVMNHS